MAVRMAYPVTSPVRRRGAAQTLSAVRRRGFWLRLVWLLMLSTLAAVVLALLRSAGFGLAVSAGTASVLALDLLAVGLFIIRSQPETPAIQVERCRD